MTLSIDSAIYLFIFLDTFPKKEPSDQLDTALQLTSQLLSV